MNLKKTKKKQDVEWKWHSSEEETGQQTDDHFGDSKEAYGFLKKLKNKAKKFSENKVHLL